MADPREMPPRYTKSTLYLVGGLSVMTVVFVAAGIADFHPLLSIFQKLAIIL